MVFYLVTQVLGLRLTSAPVAALLDAASEVRE
jgi:hypothetical protein